MLSAENCHIFNLDKFVPGFIDFISENIGLENERLFIWGPERYDFGLKKSYPITWLNSSSQIENFISVMERSERVFLHGLFVQAQVEILYQKQHILPKCYWIIWGGDLYRYREKLTTSRARLIESKRRIVISNMGKMVTGVPGDFDICVSHYKAIAEQIAVNVYPSNYGHSFFSPSIKNEGATLNVLVGNSSTPENRHIQAFTCLEPHKEALVIYCPLTYGDLQYRESVLEAGTRVFGERFRPLQEHIPVSRYREFLQSIDIGFFYNNRQQGMGNITTLLGLGKTLYAPQDLTHIRMLSELGVVVHNPESFRPQIQSERISLKNHEIMSDHFSFRNLKNGLLDLLRG